MSEENVEVIRRNTDAFSRGDFDANLDNQRSRRPPG